jgi:hypothetical protein
MTSPVLLITALLAIPSGYLVAAPEENIAPQRPVSVEQTSGEVVYSFDTASNRTTVVLAASLEYPTVWRRILLGAPAVHAIRAAYEFDGRARSHAPDTIRLSLLSDEYTVAPTDQLLFGEPWPLLSISVGDSVARYAVGFSRRRQISPAPISNAASGYSMQNPRIIVQLPPAVQEIRVSETVTASLPICDFLGLINQKQVRGNVGRLQFTLDSGVVAGLRRFAQESTSPDTRICALDRLTTR